jgi:hypothetical protein
MGYVRSGLIAANLKLPDLWRYALRTPRSGIFWLRYRPENITK